MESPAQLLGALVGIAARARRPASQHTGPRMPERETMFGCQRASCCGELTSPHAIAPQLVEHGRKVQRHRLAARRQLSAYFDCRVALHLRLFWIAQNPQGHGPKRLAY